MIVIDKAFQVTLPETDPLLFDPSNFLPSGKI